MTEYKPQFFNAEDFEGLVKIIETMIAANDSHDNSPLLAAQRVDTFLSRIDAPALKQLRLAIDAIDSWYLPLFLNFRFGRFSKLPLNQRRRVIEKIINPSGLFRAIAQVKAGARDAARTLKLLACVGYYSDAENMKHVGYLDVGDRPRMQPLDQSPLSHRDPFVN